MSHSGDHDISSGTGQGTTRPPKIDHPPGIPEGDPTREASRQHAAEQIKKRVEDDLNNIGQELNDVAKELSSIAEAERSEWWQSAQCKVNYLEDETQQLSKAVEDFVRQGPDQGPGAAMRMAGAARELDGDAKAAAAESKTSGPPTVRKLWERIIDTLKQVMGRIWDLILQLTYVKEWTLEGQLGNTVLGEVGISITFGRPPFTSAGSQQERTLAPTRPVRTPFRRRVLASEP